VREAEVRYVEREGKCLAYVVFGSGPSDILIQQTTCPIDLMWEMPYLGSFMETLGAMARVIVYDARGQGASDSISDPDAATLEMACDDALAVLEAARASRAIFFGMTAGAGGVTLGATYPQRIRSVIVNNLRPSIPEARSLTATQRKQLARARMGVGSLEIDNPRLAHDPELRLWWGRAHRLLTSPEQVLEQIEWAARQDIDAVLPTVRVPTLVLHRRENQLFDVETSRAAARRIPNARFVELPGSESDLFLGDTVPVFAAIKQFLAEPEMTRANDRVLATVLFTDIVASTEQLANVGDDAWRHLLDDHDQEMSRLVTDYRGRVIRSTGDGILATFDGAARAVRCAAALLDAARAQGITLRAGLHTGEIELRPPDIAGIAVHIASRVASLADANEVLVSRTVVDLTAGSGLEFEPRGEHVLKGVPGVWPTFAAQTNA
jgi:class 3 adenylate cyclase